MIIMPKLYMTRRHKVSESKDAAQRIAYKYLFTIKKDFDSSLNPTCLWLF